MVIKYDDVLTIITTIGDDENLQITFKQSAKGGLIAGIATALGGLVGGPPGLAAGGRRRSATRRDPRSRRRRRAPRCPAPGEARPAPHHTEPVVQLRHGRTVLR